MGPVFPMFIPQNIRVGAKDTQRRWNNAKQFSTLLKHINAANVAFKQSSGASDDNESNGTDILTKAIVSSRNLREKVSTDQKPEDATRLKEGSSLTCRCGRMLLHSFSLSDELILFW